jgi:multidrug efflux pump subunit AcrB
VVTAIDGFMINLAEALIIVIGVLVIFMGMRSAILIAFALLITVAATFIPMSMYDVSLERISLGALIIALGMLVDNAIVVTEGILIGSQTGKTREAAAIEIVGTAAMPLLGATAVAILAFAAIGASQDSTGEFCRSLFQVILFSLGLSWVVAVTSTPLLGCMILKEQAAGETGDPYKGKFFQVYRRALRFCVDQRWPTIAVVLGAFVVSLWGFTFIDQLFFPDSTRPQFYVEYWRPEGSHIQDTARDVAEIDEWIRENLKGVTDTATFTGQGAMRFMLTYTPEDVNSAYGMIAVAVEDYRIILDLMPQINEYVLQNFPDSESWCKQFPIGPGKGAKIEAMFMGPDRAVLRQLVAQAKDILKAEPGTVNVRDDWRQQVKVIEPLFSETQARGIGMTRPDVAQAVEMGFEGRKVGLYREADDLLPIIARSPQEERENVVNINSIPVWSSGSGQTAPLSQVVPSITTSFDDNIIRRMNRKRALKAQADNGVSTPEAVRRRVAAKIEAMELPTGYALEWRGEKYDSDRAQTALAGKLPLTLGMMVLIVIVLFDRIRQPSIIWLSVPLALIGVTLGLLTTGQPFGFMALLGFLSLSGMVIKNGIVLIDETDILIRGGMRGYDAVVQAAVSRARPVLMAALTTMLGMIPLFVDAFFVAMAVAIVFGLGVATFLTLLVVPTLYATFFNFHKTA